MSELRFLVTDGEASATKKSATSGTLSRCLSAARCFIGRPTQSTLLSRRATHLCDEGWNIWRKSIYLIGSLKWQDRPNPLPSEHAVEKLPESGGVRYPETGLGGSAAESLISD
jgi:hypothetical protein